MKAKANKVVKAVCFCLVAVLMINFLNDLFKPKFLENRWKFTKTINSFYDLDKDSTEVALLGTSQMAAAIDPLQLYEEQGISSYNLGIMSQPIQATYFWLKEIVKTQDIKLAVLEVKAMARTGLKVEVKARRSYDYMKAGLNKYQYAKEYYNSLLNTDDEVDLWEYLFPLTVYHSRWSSLEYDDYEFLFGHNNRTNTRGFATLTTEFRNNGNFDNNVYENGGYEGLDVDTDKAEDVHETIAEYDVKLIEYAKEHGIQLLFIKTPDLSWSVEQHNYVKKLADDYDIEFIDFNLRDMLDETGFDLLSDEADTIHANISGAKKLTEYVGNYISDNYELTDFRKTDSRVRDTIEGELDNYRVTMRDAELSFIYDFDKYIDKFDEEDYSVIVAAGSNTVNYSILTDKQKDIFESLGMGSDIYEYEENKYGINAICVRDGGKTQYKHNKQNYDHDKATNIRGSFKDGADYDITVMNRKCSARINNSSQVLVNNDACNIIVYDNRLHEVADIAYIYEYGGRLMINRKEL